MRERLLITGASGTVGAATLLAMTALPRRDWTAVAGLHKLAATLPPGADAQVRLDFTDPASFAPALEGVDRLLLVRPPQLADVKRYFAPFIAAAKAAGVKQTVLLSLQGAEANAITPHAKIEARMIAADLPWTFLRPSFFMQNLTAAHAAEIRDRDEIYVPAGKGATAFIDALDIGAVAAEVLTGEGHIGQAYELTGSEALTYAQVATILSEVLGREIRYARPSLTVFVARRVRSGDALGYAAVMGAIYSVARLGRAATLTDTVAQLLGRPPRSFRAFAEDNKSVWQPAAG